MTDAIVLLFVFAVFCICAVVFTDFIAEQIVFNPAKYTKDLSYTEDLTSEKRQEVQFTNSKQIKITGCYFPYENDIKDKNGGQNPAAVDTVLFCHGNGENVLQRAEFAEKVRREFQCNVLLFDYAGYGKSVGKPTAAGILDDGLAAFEYLTKQKNIPPQQIILWGFSLGGSVAADLASKHKVKALIIQSSFTSLGSMGECFLPFIPVKRLLREQLNTEKKLADIHCPVFISHGRADYVIPFGQGKKNFDAANEPKQFYETPKGSNGHNSPLTPQHIDKLRHFIADCGRITEAALQ